MIFRKNLRMKILMQREYLCYGVNKCECVFYEIHNFYDSTIYVLLDYSIITNFNVHIINDQLIELSIVS